MNRNRPEKPSLNQTQVTLPTNISIPTVTNLGQQTLSATGKPIQDVVSQITSTPVPQDEAARRLAEYYRAQEEYWKLKFQEDPEKALKEREEYQSQTEVEKFRTALVTSAGLGLLWL